MHVNSISGFFRLNKGGTIFKIVGVAADENGEKFVVFHPVGQIKKLQVDSISAFVSHIEDEDHNEHKKYIKLDKTEIKKEIKKHDLKEHSYIE